MKTDALQSGACPWLSWWVH